MISAEGTTENDQSTKIAPESDRQMGSDMKKLKKLKPQRKSLLTSGNDVLSD